MPDRRRIELRYSITIFLFDENFNFLEAAWIRSLLITNRSSMSR
jgi:hypothetical protein